MATRAVDKLTTKQRLIMDVIVAGDGRDSAGRFIPVDMDQLLERLPYKTTKESMQFSIRSLIGRGMIEKGELEERRGRARVTYKPTDAALMARRFTRPRIVEDAEGESPTDPLLGDTSCFSEAAVNPGTEGS